MTRHSVSSFYNQNSTAYPDKNPPAPSDAPVVTHGKHVGSFYKDTGPDYTANTTDSTTFYFLGF